MMYLNTNGGQIILADEQYFYVLNKRGFYLCSFDTEPLFVHFCSPPTNDNKITWWGTGWTKDHIIVADIAHYYYMIPRHTQEFEIASVQSYASKLEKIPIVRASNNAKNRRESKDELRRDCFSNCFRFRQLCSNSRYKREDNWQNNKAKILGNIGKGIMDRDKIDINGTIICPLPGELANDICFSIDGLTLYVLHQMGKISIIDVD